MGKITQKELMQIEYDKKQLQFAIDGSLCVNKKVIDEQTPLEVMINEKNKYLCPFCLEESNKFTIENHALIKCPNCFNQMKLKTLIFIKSCSNQDFAKWVFEYRLNGFFKKINFKKWVKKLKELGIALEFWDEYKKLKGEENTEETPIEFDYDQLRNIILGLVNKINEGMTRLDILRELNDNDVEFLPSTFNYCYKEAINQIKREKGD